MKIFVGFLLVVGYLVYFDYKRKDPQFRRRLRRERREVEKASQKKETSVSDHLKMAETHVQANRFREAASCYYQALLVSPDKDHLLQIFQEQLDRRVYSHFLDLLASDAAQVQRAYFQSFPSREMNVEVREIVAGGMKKFALCAIRDFEVDEEIYLEPAIMSASFKENEVPENILCHCLENNDYVPVMMYRFLQMIKLDPTPLTHLEMLRYLDLKPTDLDAKGCDLIKVLAPQMSLEWYMVIKGKILYNQYAITKDRTSQHPNPISRCQDLNSIGFGFYVVSSYLTHSETPNTHVLFYDSDIALHALKPIKKGDELTIAIVNETENKKKALEFWKIV